MPRSTADAALTTRAARERLVPRGEPYWRGIEGGMALGYRRAAKGGAWLARILQDGRYCEHRLGRADDALPANGADVLDFRQAQTKAIAWADQQRRIAAGLKPAPRKARSAPYTVADAIADHLRDLGARGSRGVAQTAAKARAHILPALGPVPVGRLTRECIKEWHHSIAESSVRRRGKPRQASALKAEATVDEDAGRRRRATANRVLAVLKATLNHAQTEGKALCSSDAWRLVKPFRGADAPKVRYLWDEEALRLVNACQSDFRTLASAALLTGCRYGEIAAMRVQDFDETVGTVNIPRSKSGKARHVVLTAEGREFFGRQAIGKGGLEALFTRNAVARQATRTQPAVVSRTGWAKSDQFRAMRKACMAARIVPAISFHILRHTYASRLARNGVPMPVIAAQLGHADTRMTERYAHLSASYVADTYAPLSARLGCRRPTGTCPGYGLRAEVWRCENALTKHRSCQSAFGHSSPDILSTPICGPLRRSHVVR